MRIELWLLSLLLVSYPLVSHAADADGFDYPFGPPDGTPRCAGGQCPGGWANVQEFGEFNPNYGADHLGEDWNFGSGSDDLVCPRTRVPVAK